MKRSADLSTQDKDKPSTLLVFVELLS